MGVIVFIVFFIFVFLVTLAGRTNNIENFTQTDVDDCEGSVQSYLEAVAQQKAEDKAKLEADKAAWEAKFQALNTQVKDDDNTLASWCNVPGGIDCADTNKFFCTSNHLNITQCTDCGLDPRHGIRTSPADSEQDCATKCLKNASCKAYSYQPFDDSWERKCYMMTQHCGLCGPSAGAGRSLSGFKCKGLGHMILDRNSALVQQKIGPQPDPNGLQYNNTIPFSLICQKCSQNMKDISVKDSEAVLKQTQICVANLKEAAIVEEQREAEQRVASEKAAEQALAEAKVLEEARVRKAINDSIASAAKKRKMLFVGGGLVVLLFCVVLVAVIIFFIVSGKKET